MSRFETAEDEYQKANKLFVEEEYDKALKHYTEAIELCSADSSNLSEYHEKRSTCNYQLENYTDSIADADIAIKKNPKNVAAILRKGMSYFALGEYESAKSTLESGLAIDASNTKLKTWLNKANAELAQEQKAKAAKQQSSVPVSPAPAAAQQQAPTVQQPAPAAAAQAPSLKTRIKLQHYQNAGEVIVDILGIKDVPIANRDIKIEDTRVVITFKLPDNDVYERVLDLYSEVNAADSKINNISVKTELTLKKKVRNFEWPSLEKSNAAAKPIVEQQQQGPNVRKYPSSSKSNVNWDNIEKEVKETKEEEGDPLTKLFQQIYSGADEDTRRAMMKSFSESGGTVLSTNWKEVGKEKVKVQAPDGMTAKRYSE